MDIARIIRQERERIKRGVLKLKPVYQIYPPKAK